MMGERDIYRFWTTYFTMDKLRDELEACGFVTLSSHDDVLPAGSRWEGDNVIFKVAGRKNT